LEKTRTRGELDGEDMVGGGSTGRWSTQRLRRHDDALVEKERPMMRVHAPCSVLLILISNLRKRGFGGAEGRGLRWREWGLAPGA
jgi:hypothetical protein